MWIMVEASVRYAEVVGSIPARGIPRSLSEKL